MLQVHADLVKSSFLTYEAKCVWEPTQVITWLGGVLITSTSEISTTDKRITSLHQDFWKFPRLVIQFVSLPLFAEKSSLFIRSPWRCGGLMVSALDSGASAPGSSPGLGHCVVFLGKTLYSHGASLHPGV